MSMFQTLFQSIPSISLDSTTQPESTEPENQPASFQSAGTSLANLFISLSTTNGKPTDTSRKLSSSPTPKVTDRRARHARERSPSLLDNAALFLQSLSIGNGAARKPKSPPSRRLANGVKRRQSTAGDHAKAQSINMIQLDTFLDHNHDACACLKSGSQTFVLKSLSIPENSLPEKLIDVPFHIFAHPPHRCLARHDKIAAENGVRNGCKPGRRANGALRNGHKPAGTNGVRTDTWNHDNSLLASKSARIEHECCDPVPDCAAAYYVFTNGVNSGKRDDEAAYSTRALVHKTSSGERWILKDSQSVHLKTWVDRYDPEAYHNAAVKSDVILLPNRDEESAGGTLDVTTVHALMTCLENLVDISGASGAKLDREWTKLQQYEELVGLTEEIRVARLEENEHKNFDDKFVPYDHSRVVLGYRSAVKYTSDYINASYITDYDPSKPHYIAAQAPLCSTLIDFWQMIWENECTSIVNLCTPSELVASACEPNEISAQSDANNNDDERRALVRYWPKCGAELYDTIEVHLVAEHLVQEHHMVIRSFYVVHTGTKRSRTITQFNYLSWSPEAMPASIPTLLDLRRRLHRSDHSGAPILVHCSDGAGRTGAFILIDLFLASVASESMREFNLVAAIEHLRDQRAGMVSTRMQFDTAICAIVVSIQESLKAR